MNRFTFWNPFWYYLGIFSAAVLVIAALAAVVYGITLGWTAILGD